MPRACLILMILLLSGCATGQVLPSSDRIASLLPTVVAMRGPRTIHGSCVRVAPTECVTALHVVQGLTTVEISPDVLAVDAERDLALLRVSEGPWAEIGEVPPPGSLVLLISSPVGFEQTISWGLIAQRTQQRVGWPRSEHVVVFGWGIVPGMSGGGVFDLEGHFVAIMQGMLGTPARDTLETIGFAMPARLYPKATKEGHP